MVVGRITHLIVRLDGVDNDCQGYRPHTDSDSKSVVSGWLLHSDSEWLRR